MPLFRTNYLITKRVLSAHLSPILTTANCQLSTTTNSVNDLSESIGGTSLQLNNKLTTVRHPFTQSASIITRRYFHSDVRFPNFDNVRRPETLDPTVPSRDTADGRRASAPAIVYGVGGMFGLIGAAETIKTIVLYKWLPADQRALASIEVKLSDVPEGQVKTYEWRGKPVFVAHRTAEDVARERSVPMNELRHPEKDEDRVIKDEWLVLVGVCTHLGCVPIPNEGEYKSGYFCPCHGSHYDASGRIRKGPAPTNMEVPDYMFRDDTLVIGEK